MKLLYMFQQGQELHPDGRDPDENEPVPTRVIRMEREISAFELHQNSQTHKLRWVKTLPILMDITSSVLNFLAYEFKHVERDGREGRTKSSMVNVAGILALASLNGLIVDSVVTACKCSKETIYGITPCWLRYWIFSQALLVLLTLTQIILIDTLHRISLSRFTLDVEVFWIDLFFLVIRCISIYFTGSLYFDVSNDLAYAPLLPSHTQTHAVLVAPQNEIGSPPPQSPSRPASPRSGEASPSSPISS